jgi:hypothetical protein
LRNKSYIIDNQNNVPELVTEKVREDGRAMLKAIGSPPKDVNFELRN